MRRLRGNKGLTFIELILVISLLGLVSTGAIVKFYDYQTEAKRTVEAKLVSDINVGIVTYGAESATIRRTPMYPATLDDAEPGEASPSNGFFSVVMSNPITSQWTKVAPLHYKGPSDNTYEYDAEMGELRQTNAGLISLYGEAIGQTSGIIAFASGALTSLFSNLAYVPGAAGTLEAILGSGIRITTDGAGGATVTLADGTVVSVADIMNQSAYLVNNFQYGPDGTTVISNDYVYVGYGQASEGTYSNNYTRNEQTYDPVTNTYTTNYEYTSSGSNSGVSLNPTNGYISEGEYHSTTPYTYSSTYTESPDGSYSGSYQTNGGWESFSNYGNGTGDSNYGYTTNSGNNYNDATTYSYDASTETYTSTSSGSGLYSDLYEYLDGTTTQSGDNYTNSSTYTSNNATGAYSGSGTHTGQVSNFTYSYSYDPTTRIYTSVYTDNVTGATETYTYQY